MYPGSNPSALRSREEIAAAFLTLLRTTPPEELSVKEIMDAAGLSRQTFYQIFVSREEILEHYPDTVFGRFVAHTKDKTIHNLCDAAKIFFAFFGE